MSLDAVSLERAGRTILDTITAVLSEGEIAGVAGVDGNGQSELVELLAGVRRPSAGRIIVHGADGARAMAVIPENRDLDGLVLDMTLWENLLLAGPIREQVRAARMAQPGGRRRAVRGTYWHVSHSRARR